MAGITDLTIGMTGAQFRAAFNSNFAIPPRVYNVKDYGAKGDGATDDTVAIQLTINTCFAAGGGVVYFPCGTYIISGALQTDIDGLNYNSQLYIPALGVSDQHRRTITLLGEVAPPYLLARSSGISQYGVILKSTIAGSGTFPSVIGSMGPLIINYTDCHIKNITVIVDHDSVNGITMCGINFIRTSHSFLDEIQVTGSQHLIASIIQPTAKVFGIGIGFYLDDFPRIGRASVSRGFYYGFALGEGVHCQNITSMRNYVGILSLNNVHYNYIDFATLHWNTYHVANQDETIYGVDAGSSYLQIDKGSCENDEPPDWSHTTAMVLDTENKLIGSWRSDYNGHLPMTKSGGNNFIMFDARKPNYVPTWTTETRPTSYREYIIGYNSTSGKLEGYTASGWVDLH